MEGIVKKSTTLFPLEFFPGLMLIHDTANKPRGNCRTSSPWSALARQPSFYIMVGEPVGARERLICLFV